MAETKLQELEVGSIMTRVEVATQICKSSTKEVDDFWPKFPTALDALELSWLTSIYNIVWTLVIVPLEWQTRVVVPHRKG